MVATKKPAKKSKKINYGEKARAPVVQKIFEMLDRRSWTSREDIFRRTQNLIDDDTAMTYYNCYTGKKTKTNHSRAEKLERGRRMKVMVDCITLVQTHKIEQRGKGEDKEFRLV